ncbi:competence/damage-inducible protein A [Sporosarcina sp. P37]|uniref:competence/damage-inducible protein A n=1 Tax=unclassified Sporosarcina TaxID=2647733 RepID=UPI0009C05C65|nr:MULTISPECIES: competence/damage-inducible protein A [unclassified Sporosarcina]ARD49357.1 competence/damage-inducible protein A [Sporosarcina sp. P33]ARK25830.1 competence/damage-inducible protein A [Sporosarcina sp. P37]PID19146.1 competence/damage-inducible protein A [Sporosarcina sp. P35]
MKAEIIAVGSELLLGQITNTNAKFISGRLAEAGFDVYYHTVVGDNPQRLSETIKLAQQRADILIFSGGLGPTKDDLTKQTIAKELGLELVLDNKAMQTISEYFDQVGKVMTENNKQQALVMEGAAVLPNRNGMAPGMAIEKDGKQYILLPGPPHELEPMFEDEAIPYLRGVYGRQDIISSKVLKLQGIGESELEVRIQSLLEKQTNPTIAPLASPGMVKLRITAKARTEEEAQKLILPVEQEIRSIVGEFIYGVDDDTLASKTTELLLQNDWSISAAESLTSGMFMAELGSEPGIGNALKGGVVVYNKEMKIEQLDILPSLFDFHGIVSAECAAAMAESVRERFGTTFGVGLTGAAGPEPHDGQPPGTVWIGIAAEGMKTAAYKLQLSGTRNTNRRRSVQFALHYLIQMMKEKKELKY